MRQFGDDLKDRSDSEEEELEEEVQEEDLEDDFMVETPSRRKRKHKDDDNEAGFIVQTAFDAYFINAKATSKTSSNVFSSLVPPLAADEFVAAIESAEQSGRLKPLRSEISSDSTRELLFARFMHELAEGFNLLMYGFGSKRQILNQFATEACSKVGFVVVANGFQPEFSFRDLLASVENVPGILSIDLPASTPENQSKRIYDFFASSKRHLYLIIHNIDAAPLRAPKAKSCLSLLALNPRIHIVASVDHINAPLLWSASESTTRKPAPHSATISSPAVPSRGFAWLWHDLTTLAPYDFELSYIDRTSISSAHGGGPRKKADIMAAAQGSTGMSETAALHVLASVTQKAQKLFTLIGTRQLEIIADGEGSGSGSVGEPQDLKEFGLAYDTLFDTARDNFIATNDTALRSLLGEFRDHRLVLSAQGTGGIGEILWIPLRKERLTSVLGSLNIDN